jgi:membrane associated rhomboid family serine protease
MTMAPVGIRCPEHSGRPQGVQRMTRGVQRATYEGRGAKVTKALLAINVAVYVAELAQGANVNGIGGSIYTNGVLIALARTGPDHLIGVAEGQYWRLITAAFLHYGPFHLLMNMLALWWFGSLLEQRIGSGKFLLLYLVSGLAGSAGALIASPLDPTVGASGAIFGLFGVLLAASRTHHPVLNQRGRSLVSQIGMLIVINLIFGFVAPNIDNAGHIGGLLAGLWLGFLIVPGRVTTLRGLWQRPAGDPDAGATALLPAIGVAALVVVLAVGVVFGSARRGNLSSTRPASAEVVVFAVDVITADASAVVRQEKPR